MARSYSPKTITNEYFTLRFIQKRRTPDRRCSLFLHNIFIWRVRMEDFKVIDNCLMIKLPEEVDHHKSTFIGERADWFIVKENVSHVVFDFEETKFMDSSGIGIIMGRYKKISCFGGKIFIIHPDKQIRRILNMSGLQKIVSILE